MSKPHSDVVRWGSPDLRTAEQQPSPDMVKYKRAATNGSK